MLRHLATPCLLLDLERFNRNIRRLRSQLDAFALTFRPHLKTAKSIEIARRVMQSAHGPAMVSTLREAEYYASHGVQDLVYGVGIVPAKLDRVGMIRQRFGVDVTVVLDNIQVAKAAAAWSSSQAARLTAMIEVDCDGTRAGVELSDPAQLTAIAHTLEASGVELRGVMTHAGSSYGATSAEDLIRAAAAERHAVLRAAAILQNAGMRCPILSVGSTPTASAARELSGVNEIRAGVYMFGDLVQSEIGSCSVDDIAVSVLATVIAHRPTKGWIIVDAGWMALSHDRGMRSGKLGESYGLVCDAAGEPFPDLLVLDVNQEHGIIGLRPGSGVSLPDLPIGSLVRILPNHACATCAQHDTYHVVRGDKIEAHWSRIHGW